jgi:hypothetical protein
LEATEQTKPDNETMRLAQLKRSIEEKIETLEKELGNLRTINELVDKELVGRSFKRGTGEPVSSATPPARPSAVTQPPTAGPAPTAPVIEGKRTELVYRGKMVGAGYVTSDTVVIVPDEKLGLRTSTPPFESFLIRKVLDEIREADTERAGKGEIRPDQILAYDVEDEDSLLKRVIVRNYGDSDRLNRVIRAAAWTFMVMSQK